MADSKADILRHPACADAGRATADQWYESHADWLRRVLQRDLRVQPSEADDLVQDTYLRAIRTPLADVEKPRAFLSKIAHNLFRDGKRRERVRSDHRRTVIANDANTIDPRALTQQEADVELERIVLDLPQPIRDVFVLSRFQRMSNKDIAAHFGISVKTVEWRIGKAIELCVSRLRG